VTAAAAYFTIALVIGVVAAGVVVLLIVLLLQNLAKIQRSVDGLLEVAGKVGANTASIPQLEATAPVLALIVEEAVVQDGYMNALTDGFDGK
jgi:predicted Zn-dependent protease